MTVVSLFGEASEAAVRNSAARLLMAIAIGILEGESGDAITGGAWTLTLAPPAGVTPTP